VEIVGTGPLEPVLREQAAQLPFRTHFTGFLSQDELVDAYDRSDIFVFPTLGDTLGMVLVEACAAGLPCVASELAGATRDLVSDGESGLIVDPQSTESLAGAIAKLCNDPARAYQIGQAAYRRTLRRTPQTAADRYCAAIEAVLRTTPA
jgi:glycosyltransferase involved in cell wall biosynthesis